MSPARITPASIRRLAVWASCAFLLLAIALPLTACMSAEAFEAQPAFRFSIDTPGYNGGGTSIRVIRDATLAEGQALWLNGWLATEEGISGYEYRWVPVGGTADWQTVESPGIHERRDLAPAGVSYTSGHATAGFNLPIAPPSDAEPGYYDIYLRGIDGMGRPCDILALLGLCYGNADINNDSTRIVNLARLAEEASKTPDAVLRGGATVTAEGIALPPGASVRLGQYPIIGFEQVYITVATADAADVGGKQAIIGLKSAGTHPFGKAGEAYNMTDSLAYAPLSDQPTTLLCDLSASEYDGEVWLTAYTDTPLTVTNISFIYTGYATDRVAAKIRFSEDLLPYFSSMNKVTVKGVTDPTLGPILRIEATELTNDPYTYFHAGRLLEEADITLGADDYRYMVVLSRTPSENAAGHASLYLCAGTITGPSGSLNHSYPPKNDGQWHYYLLDLGQNPLWSGLIYGWRFDFINGNARQGNYMDIASIQLFRTEEGARAAAARDPADEPAFACGDPAVIRDMSEEGDEQESFTPDPDDTYIVTETEAPPVTEPSDTASVPDTPTSPDLPESPSEELPVDAPEDEKTESGEGCSSVAVGALSVLLPVAALSLALRRRKYTQSTMNTEEVSNK